VIVIKEKIMKEKITFLHFLCEKHDTNELKIVIPIIQRDYAQGRIGKENLRYRLLHTLKKALDEKSPLTLDFVYGSLEGDKMYPLDGQQRLTTLWLLHWYIAYKSGNLNEVANTLRHFSYETRASSSAFCDKICDLAPLGNDMVLRTHITNQTWFISAWQQDPTIQAMLNMLCGTDILDKNENDIVDGIDEIFQDTDVALFNTYWELLSGDDCPIVFYYLDMKDDNLPLTDDLYIKMNARGKQLTDLENFKADLLDVVKTENWEDSHIPLTSKLGYLMDMGWTDVFWSYRSHDKRIDEIYFAFINRYLFNEMVIAKGDDDKYLNSMGKQLSELYGKESNDADVGYFNFNKYSSDKKILKRSIDNLRLLFANYLEFVKVLGKDKLQKMFQPVWLTKEQIAFIPQYTEDEDGDPITTLTQTQRVVFHAICRYFEKTSINDFNEQNLSDWVCFVWNMSESINTIDAMYSALRFIDELSDYCGNILEYLAHVDVLNLTTQYAKEQYVEEVAKAKQIMIDGGNDWRIKIRKAEGFLSFNGSIRFLFQDAKGELNDWGHFDIKFQNLQNFFDKSGVCDDEKSEVKVGYNSEAILLKRMISYCTKWEEQLVSGQNDRNYIYDNQLETWRTNIFLRKRFADPVHHVLMGDDINPTPQIDDANDIRCNIFNWLISTNLLNNVAEKMKKSYLRNYWGWALYPSSEGVYLDRITRDRLLISMINNTKVEEFNFTRGSIFSQNEDRTFFKGWNLDFIYMNCAFRWASDDSIYLMKDNDFVLKNGVDKIKVECNDKWTLDDFIDELNALSKVKSNVSIR
jgi:hypothetical protein